MNNSDIEQIVYEVVRRLKAADVSTSCSAPLEKSDEPREPTSSLATFGGTSGMPIRFAKTKYTPDIAPVPLASSSGDTASDVLVTDDRLLTLAKVSANLDGLRRLVVHKKTIITPALREELSRRGIAVERGGSRPGTRADFAISVVRFAADRAPNLHGLGLAEDVQAKSFSVVINLVNGQLVQSNRHVVVLTEQTSAALCVLNRTPAVRAALANNVESVKAAAKAVAANVLVVDPHKLGRVQLAAILRAFENEGMRNIPSELLPVLQ